MSVAIGLLKQEQILNSHLHNKKILLDHLTKMSNYSIDFFCEIKEICSQVVQSLVQE